jgi:hypothetical protein
MVVEVLPGDQNAAAAVQGWLEAYSATRDPQLREQIILAYLGLADRLPAATATAPGPLPRTSPKPPGPG